MTPDETPDFSETQTRLSIAHVMPWAGIGGVEIATLRIVDATRDRFRHVALCMRDATMLQDEFARRRIEVFLYDPPEPSLRHFPRFYRESQSVAATLRAARADIAHFQEHKAAMHCGLGAVLAGVKRISHVRNTFPVIPWREKLTLQSVQDYIFVSKHAKKYSAVPTVGKKLHVLYDAVEVRPEADDARVAADVRRDFGIPTDATIVGMVARVNPQKDYVTLAHAASVVLQRAPNTYFFIVGDNSLVEMNRQHYAEIATLLNGLGIAKNFVFSGHRPDVDRLIQAMDFCVLSTHREGVPLSILETMGMGKAIVATEVGGIPEVVEPGRSGFLSPHKDSAALSGRLLQLIEHPDQAQQMGRYAREHVRTQYSKQGFADGISRIYEEVGRR